MTKQERIIRSYFKIAIMYTTGFALFIGLTFSIVLMFVHGALKQDEINRANDCAFAKDKPFAQEWYLKNCTD